MEENPPSHADLLQSISYTSIDALSVGAMLLCFVRVVVEAMSLHFKNSASGEY